MEPRVLVGLKARPRELFPTIDGPFLTIDEPTAPASAAGLRGAAALLAHGAGGHKDHPHLLDLSALLTGLGLSVARFDFPYRAKGGKRPPDPMPALLEAVRSAAATARARLSPSLLVLAGHSMGGRACSMAVAEGLACDGLLLFSYPWHPPGRPDRPRKDHLPRLAVPVLCVTGERDPFCDRERLGDVLSMLPKGWTQAWIKGADHSLEVPRRGGRTRAEVLAEVSGTAGRWLAALRA